ncbi:MAG: peptidylprolyl isomerase [Prevotella sp.]
MKYAKLFVIMLFCSAWLYVGANEDDPVIMKINGKPIVRSEFEYSYNKNNTDDVIDKKTVDEYVDLFVNYKLKVEAALDAHLDTLSSFKKEFATYRDQQVRPSFVTDDDVEKEALDVYERTKQRIGERGLIKPAHILIYLEQDADKEKQDAAMQRADSVYNAVISGADFADLAKRISQDPGSARNGGELPWLQPGQTLKEFEDAAYALNVGDISRPVLSPVGYHIIKMNGRKQFEPYDSLRTNIIKFIESRNIREHIVDKKLEEMVNASDRKLTKEDIIADKTKELTQADEDLKYLIQEYHDGLLLYEISNREVWEKASGDEKALNAFFEKNKKKYKWDEPRFKGIVYHVKQESDINAVKECVKNVPFKDWADKLRTSFNNDSTIRIRAEKGIFKKGDNAFVDKIVFKKDTTVNSIKNYPIDAVCGKILKNKPENYEDVRGLVTADYQELLEKQWIAELRKRYTVDVYDEIMKTVNNHSK